MFSEGSVLYFTPYYFTKGDVGKSKNKYFVVIKDAGNDILVTSLPTSQDHIPSKYNHLDGCINIEDINFNCYKFPAKKIVSACNGRSFPHTTYIYGANIDILNKSDLLNKYPNAGSDYRKEFALRSDILEDIKQCLKNSRCVKRAVKRCLP